MDVQPCRRFFLDPQLTFHRRYEALRAFFVEDRPVTEIASQFGYKPTALKVNDQSVSLPVSQREYSPLFVSDERGRPSGQQRCEDLTGPEEPPIADQQVLNLRSGRRLQTRNVGVFLFLPLLATLRFDSIVAQADYPGSEMVPASSAVKGF